MRSIVYALLACGILFACGGSNAQMETSPLGNRYQLFKGGGSGDPVATGDFVYFHAAMRSEGDSILFSTRQGGGEQPVVQAAEEGNDQIGPVEDVIRFMRTGDSAVVRVNIAKFPNKPPGLENDTVILYSVVVTEILSKEEFEARTASEEAAKEEVRAVVRAREAERTEFSAGILKAYKEGTLENIQTTPSGLKYVIHEEGTGAQAEAGKGVVVQYIGQLVSNGTVFDLSFARGEGIPFQLGVGRVIPGWDEGIALLKEGSKATFFIPAELAYGAQGTPDESIPGGSELAFYVELEKVE